jgi:heme/copper-type cytochrome/quinol oxidase subunit 2
MRIGDRFSAGVALAALALCVPFGRAAEESAVAVTIARDGIRPDTLTVRKGEVARFRVSTADDEHCFALDEFRIEKRVRPGHPVLVEFTPDRSGTFDVHCCLEPRGQAPRAKLVVGE